MSLAAAAAPHAICNHFDKAEMQNADFNEAGYAALNRFAHEVYKRYFPLGTMVKNKCMPIIFSGCSMAAGTVLNVGSACILLLRGAAAHARRARSFTPKFSPNFQHSDAA
jgi:hypothetical protein